MLLLFVGPLSMDRYAEIDDDVDVEQCSDSEAVRNARRTAQTSLASPSCASDDERSTPEQISVSKCLKIHCDHHHQFNIKEENLIPEHFYRFLLPLFSFTFIYFTDQITSD